MFSPQCHNSSSYVHINFIITQGLSNSSLHISDKSIHIFSAQEVKKKIVSVHTQFSNFAFHVGHMSVQIVPSLVSLEQVFAVCGQIN